MRKQTAIDNILGFIDNSIRIFSNEFDKTRPNPAEKCDDVNDTMTAFEKQKSIRMLRVNHSGEVCAQSLYKGQAFFTFNQGLREHLLEAAKDEYNHLSWCSERLNELGGRISKLNPIWAISSFFIGGVAGLIGHKYGLAFIEETEIQVGVHLTKQLNNLAEQDVKTRAIFEQMRTDELLHAENAHNLGAYPMPEPIKYFMSFTSKIMTTTAQYI